MDIVTRACWFASWCDACEFRVAKRRWVEDVLMLALATWRAPAIMERTIGDSPHVASLRC